MIDKNKYMSEMLKKLEHNFKERLVFCGLQGSYVRGEETEKSDFDVVVLLDTLTIADLQVYRSIVQSMPHPQKACGFISGRKELANWPKHELFQFSKETVPYYGTLEGVLPKLTRADIAAAVKYGAAGIYHAAGHCYVHGEETSFKETAQNLCKAAAFILQMDYYLETRQYIPRKKDLLPKLPPEQQEIIKTATGNSTLNPGETFNLLLSWAQTLLTR